MSKSYIVYPFTPKSTAYLEPGQFWSIPLESGRFACGRVLQLKAVGDRVDSRAFLAGLMDWSGKHPPAAESIAGRSVLRQGEVHVKTIRENGGVVLGSRPLEADGIEPSLFLDRSGGPHCQIQRGYTVLGLADPDELRTTPVFSTWGYRVIKLLAEKHFG